jgi:hypothetical protein
VQRLNSWDVVQRPRTIWALARLRLDDPFGNRYLIGFVIALCGFLTLVYVGLYGFTALAAAATRDER